MIDLDFEIDPRVLERDSLALQRRVNIAEFEQDLFDMPVVSYQQCSSVLARGDSYL